MLPFPIISNTNILPAQSVVVDYVHGDSFLAVLTNTGKLYTTGAYNTALGLPDVNIGLVRSDVKKIYGNKNSLTIQTVLNEFYFIGYSTYSSAQTAGTNYTSWQNVTSLYSTLNLNLIKQIYMPGLDTFVVYTDGSLYAVGKNYNGNWGRGNTTGSASFVLLRSDVNFVGGGDPNYWGSTWDMIVTNAGVLLWSGSGGGSGSSNNVTTWTQVDTGVTAISAWVASTGGIHYKRTNNSWYIRGGVPSAYTGTGTASTANTNTLTTYAVSFDSMSNVMYGTANAAQFALYNGAVYATGVNTNGQTGIGNTSGVTSYTLIPNTPAMQKVSSFSTYSVGLSTNGRLYVCGASSKYSTGTGNVLTFTLLSIPV